MNMNLLLDAIILGVLTGSIYALMASGLTLIFGVMNVINNAQAILVVLGAYLSYTLEARLGIDPILGLVITMPAMFFIGCAMNWLVLRRIKQNRLMLSLLATYAMALLIEGLLNFIFPPEFIQLNAWYVEASLPLTSNFRLPVVYLLMLLLSAFLLALLYLLIYRTRFGFSLRAAVQNRTAATLIGIDVERVSTITFGLGVALAGAGGMGYAATNVFNISSAADMTGRLLVIIVLGGMGSLSGALVGSIIMMLAWNITSVLVQPVWASTGFFVVLVVLLLFRPQGIFGKVEGRKQ